MTESYPLKQKLYDIHEKLYSVAKQLVQGEPFPPLFCFALDDNFLDPDTYSELLKFSDKGLIINNEHINHNYYAILLFLVRAFYENCDGKDWKQSAQIRKQNVVAVIQNILSNKAIPWNYGHKRKSITEWLKTQCPILKAEKGGENSVVISVNTAFHRLLVEKGINVFSKNGKWMKLAHMSMEELQLLRQENYLLTQRLERDFEDSLNRIESVQRKNPQYAIDLWEHSRFEWMLALEALAYPKDGIPHKTYERWPWLSKIVALKAPEKIRKPILKAHWTLFRDNRAYRLYLSLPEMDRSGDVRLRIRQGSLEREFSMPGHRFGYDASQLIKEGIDLFCKKELSLELCTRNQVLENCSLPTLVSSQGCMVFRNVHMKDDTAALYQISPHTLVQTPNLKLVVLHQAKLGVKNICLHRENEECPVSQIPLYGSGSVSNIACNYSIVELQDFIAQGALHKAHVYEIRIQEETPALFYAIWKPEIEFHPSPSESLWVEGASSWQIIEDTRENETNAVYLKADGVEVLNIPEGVEKLPSSPPGDNISSEESSILASVRMPPCKPLVFSVDRYHEIAPSSRSVPGHMAEATVFYLPHDWKSQSALPSEEEQWNAAQNLETHYYVKDHEGNASYCICEPLQRLTWRWIQKEGGKDVPKGLNKKLHTVAGWEEWRLQLARPRGSKVFIHLGRCSDGTILEDFEIEEAVTSGIEIGSLIRRKFPRINPTQHLEFYISGNKKGSDKAAFLHGSVYRSKEFFYWKENDGSVRLGLCLLPEDRHFCSIRIRHEMAMFNTKEPPTDQIQPCSKLAWSDDHLCEMNFLFEDSKLPNGFYRLWIEDTRTSNPEDEEVIKPDIFRILVDMPNVAWFEKGSLNLGLPNDMARRLGVIQEKNHMDLFHRIKAKPALYPDAPTPDTLMEKLKDENYSPMSTNPLFTSKQVLRKLREDARNHHPLYM